MIRVVEQVESTHYATPVTDNWSQISHGEFTFKRTGMTVFGH